MIEKLAFVRTGHEINRTNFAAAAFMRVSQDVAHATMRALAERHHVAPLLV